MRTWTLLMGMDMSDTVHLESIYLDKWMDARMRKKDSNGTLNIWAWITQERWRHWRRQRGQKRDPDGERNERKHRDFGFRYASYSSGHKTIFFLRIRTLLIHLIYFWRGIKPVQKSYSSVEVSKYFVPATKWSALYTSSHLIARICLESPLQLRKLKLATRKDNLEITRDIF